RRRDGQRRGAAEPIGDRRDRRDRARGAARRLRAVGLGDAGEGVGGSVDDDLTPYSPLHDGAVIIRGDTIVGAGCILPLSQAALLDRSLGTRHRAALGLSEETDALVLV